MGIGPSEARQLAYWEYAALLHGWNARHDRDSAADAVTAPDDGFVAARHARLAERGIARAGG